VSRSHNSHVALLNLHFYTARAMHTTPRHTGSPRSHTCDNLRTDFSHTLRTLILARIIVMHATPYHLCLARAHSRVVAPISRALPTPAGTTTPSCFVGASGVGPLEHQRHTRHSREQEGSRTRTQDRKGPAHRFSNIAIRPAEQHTASPLTTDHACFLGLIIKPSPKP
jgi:hypothetical protein